MSVTIAKMSGPLVNRSLDHPAISITATVSAVTLLACYVRNLHVIIVVNRKTPIILESFTPSVYNP